MKDYIGGSGDEDYDEGAQKFDKVMDYISKHILTISVGVLITGAATSIYMREKYGSLMERINKIEEKKSLTEIVQSVSLDLNKDGTNDYIIDIRRIK